VIATANELFDEIFGAQIAHSAVVHPTAVIGAGSVVWYGAQIREHTRIGLNCVIGFANYVGHAVTMGDRTRCQQHVAIADRMVIGTDVYIGPGVVFMDDKTPRVNNPTWKPNPPTVERGVSIGAGALVMAGVRLGEGCRIGAGAVVLRDVDPYTTVVGNPARLLRQKES
jgi:UDP-2-acetamido-3-amino-2,3-dideoxy-glucuronate N-acetyltransferase